MKKLWLVYDNDFTGERYEFSGNWFGMVRNAWMLKKYEKDFRFKRLTIK